MKLLLQKYHGLPGIGVNGKVGDIGEKGQSIYAGFINEFFTGDPIEIDSYIYAAKRTYNHVNDSALDASTKEAVKDAASEELAIYSSSILNEAVNNSSTDPSSYLNYNTMFYTGTQVRNASIATGILSRDTIDKAIQVELELNGDLISMAFMINSANSSNPSTNFVQYHTEYDDKAAQQINQDASISPDRKYNVTNEVTYYKFSDDAKLYMNKFNGTDWEIDLSYDTNDAIYENSSVVGSEFEIGTNFLHNYAGNSNYVAANMPSNSSIPYVSENIKANDSSYFVTDGNLYYGKLTANGLQVNKVADKDGYVGLHNTSIWSAYYKTSFKDKKLYHEGDLKDSTGDSLYGVVSPVIFNNKGTELVSVNMALYNYNTDYRDRYLNANTYPLYLKTNEGLEIFYEIVDDTKALFVPNKLKSIYKAGDVLYFYTNTKNFKDPDNPDYHCLLYMVTLTDDLLGCSPIELIQAALLIRPLEIKMFYTNNNRLVSYNTIGVLKNSDSSANTYLTNKAIIGISDTYSQPPVFIGTNRFNSSIFNSFGAITSNGSIGNVNTKLLSSVDDNNNFNLTLNSGILKVNNLFFNKNNITNTTNVELYNDIYDSHIKFYDNYFIKPLLDVDLYYGNNNENSAIFAYTISADDYFYNIETNRDYFYGCDIYNEKMEKISTLVSTKETLDINIVPFNNNKAYYVLMFASYGNGLKYFSKLTKLDISYETYWYYENVKDIELPRTYYASPVGQFSVKKKAKKLNKKVARQRISGFEIKLVGNEQSIIKEKKSGNLLFVLSDITVERTNDASLSINVENPSVKLQKIIFNCLDESTNFTNSWFSATLLDASTSKYTYNLTLASNLPEYDSSKVNTLSEYVILGASEDESTLENIESSLFINLTNKNYVIPESKQRSILVTGAYKVDGSDEIFYENFNIVLPGFKDTRDLPKIELIAHNKIEELLSYNTVENGVLSNQFVSYVDINIKDFKKLWGQFLSDDVSIYLDCSIENLPYDIDWQEKYCIDDITKRATFRALSEKAWQLNNYVKLNAYVFRTKDNLLTINTNSVTDTSLSLEEGGAVDISINHFYSIGEGTADILDVNAEGDYILCDSSFIKVMQDSSIIYKGLLNNIILNLTDIPVTDSLDDIKLKIETEFGNPMISNIYYRFVVSKAKIKVYRGSSENASVFRTSIYDKSGVITTTYLGKNDEQEIDGIHKIVRLKFKYLSEPLNMTFNPLSYIMCPADAESQYTNIYGNTQKYGIKDQIKKELKFFNSSVYSSNIKYDGNDIKHQKLFVFDNLLIKKSYILDNVKALRAYPMSLYDIIDFVNTSTYALNIDSSIKTHNVLDFIDGNKYVSIAYHSTVMLPKIQNDKFIFEYNDEKYLKYKYDQKYNNLPIFAYDEESIELRDNDLITSMDKWNDYYNEYGQYKDAKTYQGILSLFGNGYTQILEKDANNASLDCMPLSEVIELNSDIINLYTSIDEVDIIPAKDDLPNNGQYLRGPLYDINWEFPYYFNNNEGAGIIPYRIVSPFDNFLNNIANDLHVLPEDVSTIYGNYYNALVEDSSMLYQGRMIPYNLLFDIQPRIAYNYETASINVFMLRRPSIGIDTDVMNSSTDIAKKYNFNNRLFELSNFVKLVSPYKIK